MFKVKKGSVMNYVAIFVIFNEENTHSKRCNLRKLINADFVLPRFKIVASGRHSLRFRGPQLQSKLSKEERNIGTLDRFRTTIH